MPPTSAPIAEPHGELQHAPALPAQLAPVPQAPLTPPNTSPTVLETFATTGE